MRAPFQVIVFPYYFYGGELKVLIGKRFDDGYWQAISGGGENDEKPLLSAKRELKEEAGIEGGEWLVLDSKCMLPKIYYEGFERWGDDIYVIPEYAFATKVGSEVKRSDEHAELRWVNIETANELLKYGSNKIALWELSQRVYL